MAHRPKTKAGRTAYALRKQTVEPVFGIISSVLGFRQFLLRLAPVRRKGGLKVQRLISATFDTFCAERLGPT